MQADCFRLDTQEINPVGQRLVREGWRVHAHGWVVVAGRKGNSDPLRGCLSVPHARARSQAHARAGAQECRCQAFHWPACAGLSAVLQVVLPLILSTRAEGQQ